MIHFEKIVLNNGLTVICHADSSTPLAAVSVLYKAGSKLDPAGKSGLAHIFEHLMFSGTPGIPDFDTPIQMAGGENNAYTNSDYAQYYSFVPGDNVDILLWLESDRMQNIKPRQRKIQTQKKVVLEEFYESCLNVPYGDIWHYILPILYPNHPYGSPVIGKSVEEIMSLSKEDFFDFKQKYYQPKNAILSVSGMISPDEIFRRVDDRFGSIPSCKVDSPTFPFPAPDFSRKDWIIRGNVPAVAFFLVFPMPERRSRAYYHLDFISDILTGGRSARLYRMLVKNKQLVSFVDAYISGSDDPGLFVIEGKILEGESFRSCEKRIWSELEKIKSKKLNKMTMRKLKNNLESQIVFSEINIVNKSANLCYFESIGKAEMINEEIGHYLTINEDELSEACLAYLNPENCFRFLYVPDSYDLNSDPDLSGFGFFN
jgi:zinc protease